MAQREIAVEVNIPRDDAIDPKAFRKLMQRAEQGDATALAQVRERFDAVPAVWDELGNLAVQTQRQWIRLTTGGNALMDEAVRKASDHLRSELLGPQPSPLERLLAERIVACHLQVHFADQQAAAFEKAGGLCRGSTGRSSRNGRSGGIWRRCARWPRCGDCSCPTSKSISPRTRLTSLAEPASALTTASSRI